MKANIPTLRNFVGGMLFGLLIVGVMATTVGCSNQWRESDPGIDGSEAFALFDEISQNANGQNFSQTALNEVREDQYATLYFAQSGGSMGPMASVFSFSDTSFLGSLFGQNVPIGSTVFDLEYGLGVTDIAVIFYDGVSTSSGERYFTLMMKFTRGTETSHKIFQSAPKDFKFGDKDFETRMPVAGGTLILRSNDVSPDTEGELAGTIKLEAIFEEAGSGNQYDIGQFSVLHGFGGAI
jgi:hypothetical protein